MFHSNLDKCDQMRKKITFRVRLRDFEATHFFHSMNSLKIESTCGQTRIRNIQKWNNKSVEKFSEAIGDFNLVRRCRLTPFQCANLIFSTHISLLMAMKH